MVSDSILRRPYLSARGDSTIEPIGRMTKPRANVASVASSDVIALPDGKNWAAKTLESSPYIVQSYHSMKLPIKPPITVLPMSLSSTSER